MNRIKKNDMVIVKTGKSTHHVGKVLRVVVCKDRRKVVVEGANLMKKHVKPNPQLQQKGGIVLMEAPIDCSNVAMYNPQTKKADKIGFRFVEKDGKQMKVRYFKSDKTQVDLAE